MAWPSSSFIRLTRLRRRSLNYALLLISRTLPSPSALQTLARAPSSPAILAAELSRYYWFLSQWQWFELLGLAGPLIILTLLLRRYRNRPSPIDHAAATLCRAAIAAGLIATAVALLFAHESSRAHLVARLQPLRIFLPIYAVMTLLLGATLTQLTLEARQRSASPLRRRTLAALPAITLPRTRRSYVLRPATNLPRIRPPRTPLPGRQQPQLQRQPSPQPLGPRLPVGPRQHTHPTPSSPSTPST